MNLMSAFLWVARLEGLSLLVLFFVAMPLKYGAGWSHATEVPGWFHGLLFVAYVGLLAAVAHREGWSPIRAALGFLAAFAPFGTFLFEWRLQQVEG